MKVLVEIRAVDWDRCQRLIELAGPRLSRSMVILPDGRQEPDPYRTSDGMFLPQGENEDVVAVETLIAELLGLPVSHMESLQVLRYRPGQEFKAHQDTFDPKDPGRAAYLGQAGQRLWTGVLCLRQAAQGGELAFPKAGIMLSQRPGDLCIFSGTGADGIPDPAAMHQAMPVKAGEKWSVASWFRERPFR